MPSLSEDGARPTAGAGYISVFRSDAHTIGTAAAPASVARRAAAAPRLDAESVGAGGMVNAIVASQQKADSKRSSTLAADHTQPVAKAKEHQAAQLPGSPQADARQQAFELETIETIELETIELEILSSLAQVPNQSKRMTTRVAGAATLEAPVDGLSVLVDGLVAEGLMELW
jgi:hypothetical protein